jgi:hypothetical protein
MGMCWVVGCGQDLALPDGYGKNMDGGEPGPADGITGAGGAGDGDDAPSKLPVAGEPRFTVGGGGSSAGKSSAGKSGAGSGSGGQISSNPSGGEGGVAGSPPEAEPVAQLLFSEYVEGSSKLKALELFALAGGTLEGCELQTYSNGKTEPTRIALHGALETGALHVLCTTDLATAQPAACSRSTNLTFNGDDALALSCAGTVQDVFGEIGVDPGESWGAGATVDHTLQRRCEISAGRTEGPFEIDAEWLSLGVDSFSDLGQRACEPLSR